MDADLKLSLVEKAVSIVKNIDEDRLVEVVSILEAVSYDAEFCKYLANLASCLIVDDEEF